MKEKLRVPLNGRGYRNFTLSVAKAYLGHPVEPDHCRSEVALDTGGEMTKLFKLNELIRH